MDDALVLQYSFNHLKDNIHQVLILVVMDDALVLINNLNNKISWT